MPDALARILDLPAPTLLIGSVLVVSLWGWIFAPARRAMILNPYRVRHAGEVHRLLTAGWLHADLSHVALNMVMLWFFARETVPVLGVARFLLLYLSAVPVAFIPTTLRHMHHPAYNSLGASGAVAAVMISSILLHPRVRFHVPFFPTLVPGAVLAVGYLAYSLWHSISAGDNVNHDAHFSGALYGALLTYAFEPGRVERSIKSLLPLWRMVS
jgi:membrane associated rhomboid family serine protease